MEDKKIYLLNEQKTKYLKRFKTYLDIKDYSYAHYNSLKSFLYYATENKINILTLSYDEFSSYIKHLKDSKYSKNYINIIINAVRSFYNYLIDSKQVTKEIQEILTKFSLLKIDKKIRPYITLEDLDEVISSGMTLITRMEPIKLRTLLYFMFFTGVRRGELLNLKRKDINIEKCEAIIRIPTKNKDERYVVFPKILKPLLKSYFRIEAEEQNAFNITINSICYLIKQLCEYLPENKKITPHIFRHSFAMMMASKNINAKAVQMLLGHKSLDSTMVYYNPNIDMVKNIYEKEIG